MEQGIPVLNLLTVNFNLTPTISPLFGETATPLHLIRHSFVVPELCSQPTVAPSGEGKKKAECVEDCAAKTVYKLLSLVLSTSPHSHSDFRGLCRPSPRGEGQDDSDYIRGIVGVRLKKYWRRERRALSWKKGCGVR